MKLDLTERPAIKIVRRAFLIGAGAGAAWFVSRTPALAECASGDWTVTANNFISTTSGARKRVQVEPSAGVQATGTVDFAVKLDSFAFSTNLLLAIGWPKFTYKSVVYDDAVTAQNVRVVAEFGDNRLSRVAQAPHLLSTLIRVSEDELNILKSSPAIACRLLLNGEPMLQCQLSLVGLAQAMQTATETLQGGKTCPG
jgi:hypothetical protein